MQPHPSKATENRFILAMALTAIILVAEIIGIEHTTIQIECAACGQGRTVPPLATPSGA